MINNLKGFVSIVVTTYNRVDLICETIESCLKQTYKEFEILVIDDGSTDKTKEVLNEYIIGNRIKYYYKKNEERAVARNFGVEKANGELIKFLDSDDLIEPNYLEECIRYFISHQSCDLIYTNTKVLANGSLKKNRKKNIILSPYENLWKSNEISYSSVIMKKESFLKFGSFDTNLQLSGAEDWEFWLRISKLGGEFGFVDAYVTIIRVHESNNTMRDISKIIFSSSVAVQIFKDKFQKIEKKNLSLFESRMCFLEALYSTRTDKRSSFKSLKKAVFINPLLFIQKRFWFLFIKILLPKAILNLISKN